ncbi:MFS family permease [Haloferula luteola]|uniref:MFS family permease n=1 Tax=Haloferula luteola TaxID=595692 RepID=A0A840V239_9BACT|nr:MFS transporter [Haloferula luteola]MBB5352387.1 MFS family permease [Haloferula luteola]
MPEKPRPEIPDTTTADLRRLPSRGIRLPDAFSAFQHRNYRIFFTGQVISLVGTWLQSTAEGWLVYQLRGSSVDLGFIRFSNMLPFALLALFGGIVADRHAKRSILLCTQIASMMLALLLALLVWRGVIQVWQVAAIGFLLGTVNAFDVPARQSFVVELVGRKDLDNGIALNSSMFNLARVIGPAVAGLLIGIVGMAGCFLLNGLSYLAVIAGYGMLRLPKFEKRADHPPVFRALREAGSYILGNGPLRGIMMLVSTFSLFGISFNVLMPVFAKDILGGDATTFGTLMSFNGGGALLGGLALATFGKKFSRRHVLYTGLFGCSILNSLFAFSRVQWLSCGLLLFSGFFMIIFLATANTSTQLRSPDDLRGRIMGFYSLAFLGLSSVGSLLTGFLAKHFGAPQAVVIGTSVCALIGLLLWRRIIPLPAESTSGPPE